MALIHSKRQEEGVSLEVSDYLTKATRRSTNKAYNNGWLKWSTWCNSQSPKLDPEQYNVNNIVNYLSHYQNYSHQHLNTLRSSIASVFEVIHSNKLEIAKQPPIQQVFRAKKNAEVRIPSQAKLETWDVPILLAFIRIKYASSSQLPIYDLQQKVLLLLCISAMGRPRSDLGRAQYNDVTIQENSAVIYFRQPKKLS
jgi:hypothetical protein